MKNWESESSTKHQKKKEKNDNAVLSKSKKWYI